MNARKIFAFALGPIGNAILSFITLPMLAWMFSPEDIGRFTLLQVMISFVFVFCGLSLEQAYVREFYEHQNVAALLKTTFLPGLFLILAVILISTFSGVDVGSLVFGIHSPTIVLLMYVSVYLSFITTYSTLTLRMREKALFYSLISLLNKSSFLLFVLVIYLFKFKKDFITLIGISVVSVTLAFSLAIWFTRKEWSAALKASFLSAELKGFIRFSLPLMFGGMAYWGLTAVDRISIRWWSSFEQVGVFSVAAGFAGVAVLFQSIFTTVWTPFIYRWNTEGIDVKKLNQLIEHVLAAVVLIYSLVGSFSWAISFLLPAKYALVSYILPACMGAPLLYMLSEATGVGVNLMRKTMYTMLAPLFALVCNLALNYALVPTYGAAGASAATSIAFFVFFFLRTEFSAHLWQAFPRKKLYFFAFLCSCISSVQAVLYKAVNYYSFYLWGVLFIVSLIAFRASIQDATKYAFKHYKRIKFCKV